MKNKSFQYIVSVALLFFNIDAYGVPLIDVDISASQWQAEYSGKIGQNNDTATLNELGFDDDDHTMITAVFKHPIPNLPNIRLQHTDLGASADGTLSANLVIDGTTYNATENVATKLDLSHSDITFFYSPFNNWLQIDFGLSARYFDGEAVITSKNTNIREGIDLDEWLPLAYVGARFELPLTGWYVDATLNGLDYDDNSLIDYTGAIGYSTNKLLAGLAIELGYRVFSLTTDDINGLEGDIDIDGIYFSLGLKL